MKDRQTNNPGGCECNECGTIFIGGPEHDLCGECAAVQAAQPEAVGEWKLVPIEPTEAMIAAIYGGGMANLSEFDLRRIRTQAKLDWAAMLASAPTPEPMSAPTEATQPPSQPSAARALAGGAEQAVPSPSAPTAVEPDERAMFEAWAGPITALAKENGKYVEVMTSLAWEAWQARASKGTS